MWSRIALSIIGFSFLVACSQTDQNPNQPGDKTCSMADFKHLAQHLAPGIAADLYRVHCDLGIATPIGQVRIVSVDPDNVQMTEQKTHTEKVTHIALNAQVVIPNQSLYISSNNAGSKVQPEALTYAGPDLTNPDYAKVRPLIAEIMTAYGQPKTKMGQLRAMRDWISRIAIHPHPPFHIIKDKNTHVLPEGWDWQKFNWIMSGTRVMDDSNYWRQRYGMNGRGILNRLVNFDGTEEHPMLEKLSGPAEYRIKNLDGSQDDPDNLALYRTTLCSYQGQMMIYLAAAHGIYGTLVSTTGHDTFAFYIPEVAQWVYMDPSYDEDFISSSTGLPASPAQLYAASAMGTMGVDFITAKINGPIWDAEVWTDPNDDPRATYMGDGHLAGMTAMGSNLWQQSLVKNNFLQFDAPIFYNNPGDPFTVNLSVFKRVQEMSVLFPILGVSVAESTQLDANSIELKLASNWPYHDHFEIQEGDGSWATLSQTPILKVGYGSIKVRSVNKAGVPSTVAQFEARRL